MKSLLKVLMLVSLIVISRLDKQKGQLTNKSVSVSASPAYPFNESTFSRTVHSPIQQLFITQR